MEIQMTMAALLIATASCLALWIGGLLGRYLRTARTLLFAILVALTSLYASSWAGRLENVELVPFGPAVLLSNLTPILVCFLAGFAWQIPGVRSRRGAVALGTMVTLGVIFLFAPVLRPRLMPVDLAEPGRWHEGVCLQTHDASCGAAAAATLLSQHGVPASEREMAKYCLTSRAGTEPLALYQGLTRRSRGTGLTPRLVSGQPADWERRGEFPVLAMVAPPDVEFGPSRVGRLRKLLGRASDGHAVVILGRTDGGDYVVADPAAGRLVWSAAAVNRFYSGQAIRLGPDVPPGG